MALSNTTLGVLMSSLDGNIVLIALPTIARELPGTSLLDLLWILLGYQLVTAAVLVNFGRLADIFGRVRLYNFGFALFTAGSALWILSEWTSADYFQNHPSTRWRLSLLKQRRDNY